LKKTLITIAILISTLIPAQASEQTMLYDQVWKLINSKYVDPSNNNQNWYKWRKRYDSQIKTNEDAYVGDGVLDALGSAVVIVHSHFELARAKIKGVL